MLEAYREELVQGEDAGRVEALLPIFSALLPTYKDVHEPASYMYPSLSSFHYLRVRFTQIRNLMQLVVNTPWWNPKLHDHNNNHRFILDARTKRFIRHHDSIQSSLAIILSTNKLLTPLREGQRRSRIIQSLCKHSPRSRRWGSQHVTWRS